jgi:ParB-like chromosome segregation protein Spo0J
VVDANNVVLAGNGTLEAARSLGWKELRIVRTALTGSNATAYAIADNRTGELAEWNDDVLSRLLAEPDIGDVGFDDAEIRKLLGSVDDTPLVPIDDCYQVVVECKDDADQKRVYEEMKGRGYECRLLMI